MTIRVPQAHRKLGEKQLAALITQPLLTPCLDDRPNAGSRIPQGSWVEWSLALPSSLPQS